MTLEDGTFEIQLFGTTTGEFQVDGIATTVGTETQLISRIETTFMLGIETTTAVGTYDGTFSHEMITADGYEGIVIYCEVGTNETHMAGTTTGDTQFVGT